jgi:hypothetical protein
MEFSHTLFSPGATATGECFRRLTADYADRGELEESADQLIWKLYH